jgi:hypothetical protein
MATRHSRSAAQHFAMTFGVIYLLIGILGFILVADADDKLLGVFTLNLAHNIVHVVIGGALLVSTSSHATAKRVNLIVGLVYAVVALLGIVDVLVDDLLEANLADDYLHLATGTLAIFFGTIGAEGERSYG